MTPRIIADTADFDSWLNAELMNLNSKCQRIVGVNWMKVFDSTCVSGLCKFCFALDLNSISNKFRDVKSEKTAKRKTRGKIRMESLTYTGAECSQFLIFRAFKEI